MKAGRHRSPFESHSAAFSLIELTVSLSIMSIIMLSITSAVMIASRALPDADDPRVTVPATARVLGEIAEELRFALHISDRSAHAITFTIPDRDAPGRPGRGSPETIRYEWTGDDQTPGQLLRTYNYGAPAVVAENVHAFELAYVTRPLDDPPDIYPGPVIEESAPTRLAWQHGSSQSGSLTASEWYGQYLTPQALSLKPAAVSWRPSAVKIVAKGNGGILGLLLDLIRIRVEVRHADLYSRAPTDDAPLASNSVNERSLLAGAFNWWEFQFADAPQVSRDQPTTIVVRSWNSGTGGYLRYDVSNSASGLTLTTDGGGYWQRRDTDAMAFELWGYQSIRHPDQQLTRHHITGVGITLQVGSDAEQRQETRVETTNRPEVLPHYWQAVFTTDLATLEVNGDGVPDWETDDNVFFKAVARPVINFTEPTTVRVRFRAAGSDAATFRLDADWGPDQRGAALYAVLDQVGGAQRLTLYQYFNADGSSRKALHGVANLGTESVDLMLLVDPTRDTVNIRVNGEARGETYRYERRSMPGYDRGAGLTTTGPDASFEFVSIRVGGTP